MQGITATIVEHTSDGWRFVVDYKKGSDVYTYRVTLTKEYSEKLFPGMEAEQVIEKAFRFLLYHEPASSILSEFDVSQISDYFPDFESVVTEQM